MSAVMAVSDTSVVEGDDGAAIGEVAAAAGGSREELLVACRRSAYLAALQLVGNREDALDLAQEAVLRMLGSLQRLDPARSWRPYLMRIVANLARDLWRRRRVRRAESLETLIVDHGFDVIDPEDGPLERASTSEMRRRAARALALLSPHHREVLILRDYQGLSYAEIAAALGIPLGTVMSRLHKARMLLREAVLGPGRTG